MMPTIFLKGNSVGIYCGGNARYEVSVKEGSCKCSVVDCPGLRSTIYVRSFEKRCVGL